MKQKAFNSYPMQRTEEVSTQEYRNFSFCFQKTSAESNHPPKQEFYANYQRENESTKQVLYSYKQSNMPPDSFFFKLDLPGSVWNNTYISLLAVLYLHINADVNQHTLLAHFFLAPAQTYAANPSAPCHLLKHRMHKHASQRRAEIAMGMIASVSLLVSTMQTLNTCDSVVFASPLFPPTFRSDVPVPNSHSQIKCQT